jgi:hypothetical protein
VTLRHQGCSLARPTQTSLFGGGTCAESSSVFAGDTEIKARAVTMYDWLVFYPPMVDAPLFVVAPLTTRHTERVDSVSAVHVLLFFCSKTHSLLLAPVRFPSTSPV